MLQILVISTIVLTSIIFYRLRFTSQIKVGNIYLVQLYYLIAGVVVTLMLINVELDMVKRPLIENTPFSSDLLQNIFIGSLMVAAMGTAIHSISTSVAQAFDKDEAKAATSIKNKIKGEAYNMNRQFHQSFSHNMVYVGAILGQITMALIELNHPLTFTTFPLPIILFVGVILGIIESLAILYGSHIGFSLIASVGGAYLVNFHLHQTISNLALTPMTVLILSALITMAIILPIASLAFLISDYWTKIIIKKTFPKGHSWQNELQAKILTFKIQKKILKENQEILAYQESTPFH